MEDNPMITAGKSNKSSVKACIIGGAEGRTEMEVDLVREGGHELCSTDHCRFNQNFTSFARYM